MTQDIKQRVAEVLDNPFPLIIMKDNCPKAPTEINVKALLQELTEREEKLVECLWFYANSDNWKDGSPQVYINGEFLPDEGHLARVALNTRNDKLGINPTNGDM